jgi:NADH:ubiquinone oxidoreductase subunit E
MEWNLEEALQYYQKQGAPADQTACLNFLKEIQKEQGAIPGWMIARAAEVWNTKEGLLLALVRRIPSLRLADTHTLELCAGPNCGKHKVLAEAAEALRGGKITVKFVPCMRQCGKGPNLRWDGTLYNQADIALLKKLTQT